MQRLRTLSRILLVSLIGAHLVTWYVLGIRAVGSIGIEALFSGLSRGVLNTGFVFWAAMFISALLLGRVFCGWFCWFGGYLELVEWVVSKLKITIPKRPLLYLGIIPFVGLIVKVYNSLLENWLERFPPAFRFQLSDVEPWGGQQTGISIMITLILFGPVLLSVFGPRAWCRYLCPIGGLMNALGKVGLAKVHLVNSECVGCGSCNQVCSMQVNVLGELKAHGEVRSLDCVRCFKCTDQCAKGAIAYGFVDGEASLSAEAASRADQVSSMRRSISGFDWAVAGLWIGVTVVFTFLGFSKNAPQEAKVTMAPGLLLVIFGLVLIAEKVFAGLLNRKQTGLTVAGNAIKRTGALARADHGIAHKARDNGA